MSDVNEYADIIINDMNDEERDFAIKDLIRQVRHHEGLWRELRVKYPTLNKMILEILNDYSNKRHFEEIEEYRSAKEVIKNE